MDMVFCKDDGEEYEIAEFVALPNAERESKRRALLCTECNGFAWYRKESRLSPAHFCAHHAEDCTFKTHYEDASESGDDALELDHEASNTLIINLEEEKGGSIEVAEPHPERDPNKEFEGSTSNRFVRRRFEGDSPQQSNLRRLLLRLVRSESFRGSSDEVVFYKRQNEVFVNGAIKNVVKRFDQITKFDDDRSALFWGPIASVGKTPDGRLWLNSSKDYSSASISIFDDIVDDFLDLFEVDDIDDLLGAWVIVAGTCRFSGDGQGKPIIWCGTPNYIFVRKYRDPNLRAS
ncbi:MAG: hypothetical protein VX729_15015 [Pseudomonadota bacterium]|nr:hypothetical protein [Pseudomonadota bacterium]